MTRPRIGKRELKFPVSDAMYVAIRAEARALGVPMVALVRQLIAEHLKQVNGREDRHDET